jgi:hypothetical protein
MAHGEKQLGWWHNGDSKRIKIKMTFVTAVDGTTTNICSAVDRHAFLLLMTFCTAFLHYISSLTL